MGTFHACGNTWRCDLKNRIRENVIYVCMKGRTLSFVLYDGYSQLYRMRPLLMQDKVVAYAEKWSSTGTSHRISSNRSD